MPLAFTQEDFLVRFTIIIMNFLILIILITSAKLNREANTHGVFRKVTRHCNCKFPVPVYLSVPYFFSSIPCRIKNYTIASANDNFLEKFSRRSGPIAATPSGAAIFTCRTQTLF